MTFLRPDRPHDMPTFFVAALIGIVVFPILWTILLGLDPTACLIGMIMFDVGRFFERYTVLRGQVKGRTKHAHTGGTP